MANLSLDIRSPHNHWSSDYSTPDPQRTFYAESYGLPLPSAYQFQWSLPSGHAGPRALLPFKFGLQSKSSVPMPIVSGRNGLSASRPHATRTAYSPPSPSDTSSSVCSDIISPTPSPGSDSVHIICDIPLVAPVPLPYHSPTFLQFDLPDVEEDLSHPPYTVRPPKRKRDSDDCEEGMSPVSPPMRRKLDHCDQRLRSRPAANRMPASREVLPLRP